MQHHKVVSVDKFIDEYGRNIRSLNGTQLMSKIGKHHASVRDLIGRLREDINRELDEFEESIDCYADEMRTKTNMRDFISKSLGIPLDPKQLKSVKSNKQFE